ncbi:hypothetical protein BKA70DRAFT_1435569 [Coprinopsis sp. MPI-PUGE-AT-0042]|nr:hypothetical protein BKA70DRAFT_1435569 [Coprinopsis sp. MPI-PUGE-AT-0042]
MPFSLALALQVSSPSDYFNAQDMDGPAELAPTLGWQPSAASEIIKSPKILRIICANLTSTKDLLNMALSCKTTSSIALDEMWMMGSFMERLHAPLYHDGFLSETLQKPDNEWSYRPPKPTLLLRRSLTHQDSAWTRFSEYASRIQVLTAANNFFRRIHFGTLFQLMQLRGTQPMFPNLRSLTLSGDEGGATGTVSHLPLFVSQNLSQVHIQVNSAEKDADVSARLVESFLFMLQEKSAPLKDLSLMAKIPVSIFSFFSTLSHSNTLRILCLEGIRCLDADETNWVTNLGLLKGLEEFRLIAEEDKSNRMSLEGFKPPTCTYRFPPPHASYAMFIGLAIQENSTTQPEASTAPGPPEPKVVPRYPSLKTLYIQAPARVIDALISCVSSKVLADLTLRPQATQVVNTIPDICACFNVLNLRTNMHGSLKRFMFEANFRHPRVYRSEEPIPSSCLAPLQNMSQLEYLEIANSLGNNDNFIRSVVTQLPSVVECIIPLSSSSANITVIHALAISCPSLTRLQLPIYTSEFASDSQWFTPKKHRLRHLVLSSWDDSYASHGELFLAVRHVNAAFPYLKGLDGGQCWRTVWTMLRTIQDIAQNG